MQTTQAAAQAAGVCPRTVRKWVARFKAEGHRPHRGMGSQTPISRPGLSEDNLLIADS
jgi:transposase